MIRCLFILSLSLLLLPGIVAGKPRRLIENPKHWGAFEDKGENGKSCYVAGIPSDQRPKKVRRGDVWVLVTHTPKLKVRSEVQIVIGYTFKAKSTVTVDIDGKKFRFFTDGDVAWSNNPKDDPVMVKAMRRGRNMVVRGVSTRGTKTVDTYRLTGFTAAHKAIGKACGVK